MNKQDALARLDALDTEAKALRAIIEAPEPPEPRWKSHPKELVGKLCWVWNARKEGSVEQINSLDAMSSTYPYRGTSSNWWKHAEPLTPAEIAAMTYRESRYDWSSISRTVKYLTTDKDGTISSWIDEPKIGTCKGQEDIWVSRHGRDGWTESEIPCPDWRDSLEHRPGEA